MSCKHAIYCLTFISFSHPLQRSPLFEEHHSHKSIFNLHFIDMFMDCYANVTGEVKKLFILFGAIPFRFHRSGEWFVQIPIQMKHLEKGELKVSEAWKLKVCYDQSESFLQFHYLLKSRWRNEDWCNLISKLSSAN